MAAFGDGPDSRWQCGTCRTESLGGPQGLCGCGIYIGPRPLETKRNPAPKTIRLNTSGPRFYCASNPAPSDASPAAIVVLYGEPAK